MGHKRDNVGGHALSGELGEIGLDGLPLAGAHLSGGVFVPPGVLRHGERIVERRIGKTKDTVGRAKHVSRPRVGNSRVSIAERNSVRSSTDGKLGLDNCTGPTASISISIGLSEVC
jgi:hypothetical protein